MRQRAYIDRWVLEKIRAWVRDADLEEVGGILGGFHRHIMGVVFVPNIDPDPRLNYDFDSKAYRSKLRLLKSGGLHRIGTWHSHPWSHKSATPSRSDYLYHQGMELIICADEVRLWSFKGDKPSARNRQEYDLFVTEKL